ncbi:hypothetical protein D1007_52478 [Hordeum vulgare]|nr:hypothetical protein D1007_52478 [Hordeum vulgare]
MMGKSKASKLRKEALETFRTTHPCPRCDMHLNKVKTTLGHTDAVCKAEADRNAAAGKKRGPVKPSKK